MKFIATEVIQIDRHTKGGTDDIPLKTEYMTIEVKLIGSGNTLPFKSGDVGEAVAKALRSIKPI